jgi:hypothetical protein
LTRLSVGNIFYKTDKRYGASDNKQILPTPLIMKRRHGAATSLIIMKEGILTMIFVATLRCAKACGARIDFYAPERYDFKSYLLRVDGLKRVVMRAVKRTVAKVWRLKARQPRRSPKIAKSV